MRVLLQVHAGVPVPGPLRSVLPAVLPVLELFLAAEPSVLAFGPWVSKVQ